MDRANECFLDQPLIAIQQGLYRNEMKKRAIWIINRQYRVPAYIAIASFRSFVGMPVTVLYDEEEIDDQTAQVFREIGPGITLTRLLLDHPLEPGRNTATIRNRLARMQAVKEFADELIFLIDADMAFTDGIRALVPTLESQIEHPEEPVVGGVIEYDKARDNYLYFKPPSESRSIPDIVKHDHYQAVYGPAYEDLLNKKQFNNGLLVFYQGQTLADRWRSYYSKGLDLENINPADDQVPLAVAMQQVRTIDLDPTFNSLGRSNGSFAAYHIWDKNWQQELYRLHNHTANSIYADIARPFWQAIPFHWIDELLDNVRPEPYHFWSIKGFNLLHDIAKALVEQLAGGHIVEVGCYKGKNACFIGEMIKITGKDIRLDTIDHFQRPDTSEGEVIGNLKAASVGDVVNVIALESAEAVCLYEDQSLDAVLLDGDHTDDGIWKDLNLWFPKLKPSGILAGSDFNEGQLMESPAIRFSRQNGLALHIRDKVFVIRKGEDDNNLLMKTTLDRALKPTL